MILLGVPWFVKRVVPPVGIVDWVISFVAWTSAVVVVGAILFVVAGYEVDHNQLVVHRLLWPTRVEIRGLMRVWHDPAAVKGSLATDPKRAVVMVLPAGTVVVTPAEPDAFIGMVRGLFPSAQLRCSSSPRSAEKCSDLPRFSATGQNS